MTDHVCKHWPLREARHLCAPLGWFHLYYFSFIYCTTPSIAKESSYCMFDLLPTEPRRYSSTLVMALSKFGSVTCIAVSFSYPCFYMFVRLIIVHSVAFTFLLDFHVGQVPTPVLGCFFACWGRIWQHLWADWLLLRELTVDQLHIIFRRSLHAQGGWNWINNIVQLKQMYPRRRG